MTVVSQMPKLKMKSIKMQSKLVFLIELLLNKLSLFDFEIFLIFLINFKALINNIHLQK